MPSPEEQEDWELSVETCQIELWRGYVTSSFVARLIEGAEPGAAVDTSTSFRWRSSQPPDTEEAKLAHYELVSRLKAAGWSPGNEGGEWYETELARPTLVPPRPPESGADDAEQPPEPTPAPTPATAAVTAVASPRVEADQELRPVPRPKGQRRESLTAARELPRGRDRWRAVAIAGLVVAIVFLVVLVLHG